MKTHLAKHGIYCPTSSIQQVKKGPDIRSFMGGSQSLTHQEVLERNAIRWIVTDMKAFTTVESPEFQQMFRDIPGIEPYSLLATPCGIESCKSSLYSAPT